LGYAVSGGLGQAAAGIFGMGSSLLSAGAGIGKGDFKTSGAYLASVPVGMAQWAVIETPKNFKENGFVIGAGTLIGNLSLPIVTKSVKAVGKTTWNGALSMVEFTKSMTELKKVLSGAGDRVGDLRLVTQPKAFQTMWAEISDFSKRTQAIDGWIKSGVIEVTKDADGVWDVKSLTPKFKLTTKLAQQIIDTTRISEAMQKAIAAKSKTEYIAALQNGLPSLTSKVALSTLSKILDKWQTVDVPASARQGLPVVLANQGYSVSPGINNIIARASNNYGLSITGASARWMQGKGASIDEPKVIGTVLRGSNATLNNAKAISNQIAGEFAKYVGANNVKIETRGNSVIVQIKEGILWDDKYAIELRPNEPADFPVVKIEGMKVDSIGGALTQLFEQVTGIN